MAFEGNTGLQVANQYGARQTGATVGFQTSQDNINILSFELTGQGLYDGFLPPLVYPKGAIALRSYLIVDEAFAFNAGFDGGIRLGEEVSDVKSGLVVVKDELEVVGTGKVLSGSGVMLNGFVNPKGFFVQLHPTGGAKGAALIANPKIGKATVVLEFLYNTRNDAAWKDVEQTTKPTYKAQG